jgi:hypothetical protein
VVAGKNQRWGNMRIGYIMSIGEWRKLREEDDPFAIG